MTSSHFGDINAEAAVFGRAEKISKAANIEPRRVDRWRRKVSFNCAGAGCWAGRKIHVESYNQTYRHMITLDPRADEREREREKERERKRERERERERALLFRAQ
jgi:hypothetical protein